MPNPTDTRTLGDIAAAAVDAYLPGVIDLFFNSNPVWVRMASKERVILDGGDQIRQAILYDRMNGGSYAGLDTFDIARRQTKTVMRFDWSQYYAGLTIDGLTILKTSGSGTKVLNLVEE